MQLLVRKACGLVQIVVRLICDLGRDTMIAHVYANLPRAPKEAASRR